MRLPPTRPGATTDTSVADAEAHKDPHSVWTICKDFELDYVPFHVEAVQGYPSSLYPGICALNTWVLSEWRLARQPVVVWALGHGEYKFVNTMLTSGVEQYINSRVLPHNLLTLFLDYLSSPRPLATRELRKNLYELPAGVSTQYRCPYG